jgi:hypothetical protein
MRRDGSSGGSIRLSNITEKGIEKEYHTYESLLIPIKLYILGHIVRLL